MNDSLPSAAGAGDLTLLLQKMDRGDAQAAAQILPLVYEELRKLAAAKMQREPAGLTLQPTALVHEAWIRLGADQQPNWQSRAQFFSAAAEAMRRILIENARRRRAVRHGGALEKVSAEDAGLNLVSAVPDEKLLLIHEALERLEQHDPRKAELVKQRYFAGLTLEETAAVMGVSERTARRDWRFARAWLMKEIDSLVG